MFFPLHPRICSNHDQIQSITILFTDNVYSASNRMPCNEQCVAGDEQAPRGVQNIAVRNEREKDGNITVHSCYLD